MDLESDIAFAIRSDLLRRLGYFDKAMPLAKRAITLNPNKSSYYDLLGMIQAGSNQFELALTSYSKSLKLNSNSSEVNYRIGLIYERQNKLELARDYYLRSLECDPSNAVARVSKAYMDLIRGNYRVAWQDFEARWQAQTVPEWEPHILASPRWSKQRDSIVLVYAEQGMGDTIHFVRYAHLINQRYGCKVYLEVQKPLVRLMQTLPHIDKVFACDGDVPTDIQYVISTMSLPGVLGLNSEQTLSQVTVPYFDSGPNWRARLFDLKGLKVGLCWSGGQQLDSFNLLAVDKRRDISLYQLSPLAELDNISWVSLQVGPQSLQRYNSPLKLIDCTDELSDVYDTAALIDNLDVVVTIDTAVAHLAGALGKTVLLMARFDCCWRWQSSRTAALCYPNILVLRQTSLDDWSSVVSQVKDRLIALC